MSYLHTLKDFLRRHDKVIHGWAAPVWIALTIITVILSLFFPEHPTLLAWIIFMSGYANAVGHWSAWQSTKAETS